MKSNIVGGMTQVAYHTIPSDIDLITTNPTKQGIFSFLAQIGFERFPEFITDILTKVERHTLVDITDGPGDEKQDILTITPEGKRCLTQCKHSINQASKYNGDDLDLMVAVCIRKDCRLGILVTNTNLTPQGKKYVTDNEYLRGWPDKSDPLLIDYWNDTRIWERIKNNTDILNKWFSGLGQTHGLRNFKFEVTVQQLPYSGDIAVSDNFTDLLQLLKEKNIVTELSEGLYQARWENGIIINVEKWFQFSSRLDIRYVLPDNSNNFLNHPMYALAIEVHIPESLSKYVPNFVRREVIAYLFEDILGEAERDHWWNITSSQARSFVFLHDISETRQIKLNSAQTFVKVNNSEIIEEARYCLLSQDKFDIKVNDEDDESIWVHKPTGIEVIQMFEQKLDPTDVFTHQVMQLEHLDEYKTYAFKAIQGLDRLMMMRVRKVLNREWIALTQNDDVLLWGIPTEADGDEVELVDRKLEKLGLTVLTVRDEDRDTVLNDLRKDIPPAAFGIITDLKDVSFPINLNGRIFWLQKPYLMPTEIDHEKAVELLKYKYTYENIHGYENMMGQETMHTHTSELPHLLFDFFTIRGTRMLDMKILVNPIMIAVRFADNSIEPSQMLAEKYIAEFQEVYNDIIETLK